MPSDVDVWGDYALVLEKDGCITLVYFGSGTEVEVGVKRRWGDYDRLKSLPRWVADALNNGYKIVHKGLLNWQPIPSAALVPRCRLMYVAFEATWSYSLWGMRKCYGDYSMSHICPWNINTLEYGGLCGHCALSDAIMGNFDLTAEELEALAAEKPERQRQKKQDTHYRNMAENYDEYLDQMAKNSAKYREDYPGRPQELQRNLRAKNVEEKSFYCKPCDHAFITRDRLEYHLKTKKHKNKVLGVNHLRCEVCNKTFTDRSNCLRHKRSDRTHQLLVAAGMTAVEVE